MAINRVEIKDFLVFKGEFSADFCPGINVIIGGNGTGKTTLLRCLYDNGFVTISGMSAGGPFSYAGSTMYDSHSRSPAAISHPQRNQPGKHQLQGRDVFVTVEDAIAGYMYIPEKDILEHAKGLLTFIEQKQSGFGNIYKDILVTAQDVPNKKQTEAQLRIRKIISEKIGGEVEYDIKGGEFVIIRADGLRIPFANEASGFKKLGLLGLLVRCGHLESSSVLFWDEPENSLNPELVPVLVDILLELSRNGVQIFIATHDYNFARYFDVRSDKSVPVAFHNLTKVDGQIICNSSPEYIKLSDNLLEKASADLFKAVVSDAMEVRDDE